ncbi:Zn(II)2Cys6 transcription factor domain-containing protein ASCRUDRAFT_16297, partial [Ascoidea rubescens DSM 1968]
NPKNGTSRTSQACDRCRIKKIKCDGNLPSCSNCSKIGFNCKTSDKLTRRSFPKGYTENLEKNL